MDEFYVGYFDQAPPGLAARLRRVVIGLAVGVAGLVALFAAAQQLRPPGAFEFGVYRDFEGVLYETPVPTLRMARGDGSANLLLAGLGKWGLPDVAKGHHGKKVQFKGSLIYTGDMTMVEMNNPESFRVLGEPTLAEQRGRSEQIGPVDLTGELVDTKCYLGVMRPATGKVHRACAVRCLSGGVPPGLLVRGAEADTVLVLAGAEVDPQWAARQIRVRGRLRVEDGLPILDVDRLTLAGNPGFVKNDRVRQALAWERQTP